ncbi:Uncharacterized protein dnm_067050 [Desulfonema magnum]|uniref:Uncharacterized protein n=1 Tax=Desulfonema magnum TaxID=45655 RepID=A0A975GR63_9BACT|nr:Uncharacterized protein dnm_067050 [Desulfonema magnum]
MLGTTLFFSGNRLKTRKFENSVQIRYKYLTISFRNLPGEETRLFLPERSAARDGKTRFFPLFTEKKVPASIYRIRRFINFL